MKQYVTEALNLGLSGSAFQILVRLAEAADKDGVLALGDRKLPDIFRSILKVSYVTGYKWMGVLEDEGYIEVTRDDEGRKRYGAPTHIRLTF